MGSLRTRKNRGEQPRERKGMTRERGGRWAGACGCLRDRGLNRGERERSLALVCVGMRRSAL